MTVAELSGQHLGNTLLTAVVARITLTVTHAGTHTLAHRLGVVHRQTAAQTLEHLLLGDLLALAEDVASRIALGWFTERRAANATPAVLGCDERRTQRVEVWICLQVQSGRLQKTHHLEGDCRTPGQPGRIDASRVNKVRCYSTWFNDPITTRVLGTSARERVDHFGGVKLRYQMTTPAQNIGVDIVGASLERCGVRGVTCSRTQDQIAPQSALHQYTLALDRIRYREKDVVHQMALILVQKKVFT
mmetsp:Transcript_13944/g.41980  ORF Transcript_13944/g.41980 Transcript_13944/m.41980 type:complete len:246 (+) Transcript_13944:192-929(+)